MTYCYNRVLSQKKNSLFLVKTFTLIPGIKVKKRSRKRALSKAKSTFAKNTFPFFFTLIPKFLPSSFLNFPVTVFLSKEESLFCVVVKALKLHTTPWRGREKDQ